MSKKRALVLGLVLLPLAVGGGIIASLAKGTRSSDLTGLEAPANANDLANSAQETPAEMSPRIEPASIPARGDAPVTPTQSTPTRQEPSATGETITIDSDEATSEPMFASTAFTPADGDELPVAGTYARSALYTLAGRAHGSGGGGGGGGGTTVPSGNTDTNVSPDNTSKNPTGGSGESSTGPSSDSNEDTNQDPNEDSRNDEHTTPSEIGKEVDGDESTDKHPPENPPGDGGPIYFPPTDEPSKPVQVPEPASLALLGLGLLGCGLARRKRV